MTHTIAPRLAAVIDTPTTSETIHLPGEAIQLANSMIRTRGGPIENEYVSTVSVAVMKCLVRTDDMDVIQVSWSERAQPVISQLTGCSTA